MMTTATSKSIMLLLLPLLGLVADTNTSAGQAYCTNPIVPEGQLSVMTFHFGRDIDKDSVGFFIYLRRVAEPGTDILRCDRQNPVSQVECKSKNTHFKFGNLTSNSISVLIQNTSKELQDNYTLQIYEKSSPLPAIVCTLTVIDEPHISSPSPVDENDNNAWIAAPVIIVLLLLVVGVAGILYYLRKRSGRNKPAKPIAGDTKTEPLLGNGGDSYKRKRWFFERFTTEDEAKLLKSEKTKPGSFLITVGSTNPNHFILAVYFDGVIKRFPISRTNNGVKFLDTNKSFRTLSKLVKYYKKHDIKVGDTVWGQLSKHFRKDPESEWYFGKFTRKDEDQLLQAAGDESAGSFLIRDGVTDQDDYVLAVSFEGAMKHFTIIEEEDGFNFRDTAQFFTTLTDLVDYFKDNEINVGGKAYGSLTQPFEKKQLDALYLEEFTAKDDDTFLQSHRKGPGSFLITTGRTNPNHYILAVYFDGALKRFPISREGNGYKFLDTGMFFRTLTELLNYYKAHDIQSGDQVWGKLYERFRPEPKEGWYFGKFTRDDEQKLLLSAKNGPGSFMIRDGTTDPTNYVLAVNCAGKINHFTIIPEENGFKLRETYKVVRRLADLVDHYKEHEIVVDGKDYGKLLEPFVK